MVSPMTDISERVLEALQNDPRIKTGMIDVSCNQGVCTLTGDVKTEAAREAAEEVARAQPGVVTVINELKVIK